jgi:hypothetical protein
MNLSLEEWTEYAGQGVLLMKELEGAAERALNRNAEEVLLDQPKSEAPRIPHLQQELQPYLNLRVCPSCLLHVSFPAMICGGFGCCLVKTCG